MMKCSTDGSSVAAIAPNNDAPSTVNNLNNHDGNAGVLQITKRLNNGYLVEPAVKLKNTDVIECFENASQVAGLRHLPNSEEIQRRTPPPIPKQMSDATFNRSPSHESPVYHNPYHSTFGRRDPRFASLYGGRNRDRVQRKRIVTKSGDFNVTVANVDNQKRRYIADFFTTLVDIKWRWTIIIFSTGFLLSWLFFAVLWYIISYSHGDLAEDVTARPPVPCVEYIDSFSSAFLFSIETQHTIGYGNRVITEECPEAVVALIIQSITGVLIQCFVVGMVFSKIARPKKRAQTLIFSRNACICRRDGMLCLLFRVGDVRRSQILEAHIRALVIKKKVTTEGETIPLHRYDVNIGFEDGTDRVFMIWPVTICHKIDQSSPFYEMKPEDFQTQKFELVCILEGVTESTGMTTQARSSYINGEILWGYRFQRMVTFQREDGMYRIDFSRLHNTIPVETPRLSAKQMDDLREKTGSVDTETVTEDSSPIITGTVSMPEFVRHASPNNRFERLQNVKDLYEQPEGERPIFTAPIGDD